MLFYVKILYIEHCCAGIRTCKVLPKQDCLPKRVLDAESEI